MAFAVHTAGCRGLRQSVVGGRGGWRGEKEGGRQRSVQRTTEQSAREHSTLAPSQPCSQHVLSTLRKHPLAHAPSRRVHHMHFQVLNNTTAYYAYRGLTQSDIVHHIAVNSRALVGIPQQQTLISHGPCQPRPVATKSESQCEGKMTGLQRTRPELGVWTVHTLAARS